MTSRDSNCNTAIKPDAIITVIVNEYSGTSLASHDTDAD
jgi:hypothetical protein